MILINDFNSKVSFKKSFHSVGLLGLLILCSLLVFGCASEEKNLDTPEGMFAHAKEFDDAERYDIAIQKYSDVRNKFPYSQLATEAELAIADVYYKKESYAEAQLSFQNFRDLHPKHPRIDYVIFKTAMSYYLQLPETIDRDLSTGADAIYHFNEIIKLFPKSDYAKEATENREDTFKRLAEKELYIANFYLKQKSHMAALRRYEGMLKKYSGHGLDAQAHLGIIRAAKAADDEAKVKQHKAILAKSFSDSDEFQTVKNEGL
jgi:outer membrane protein assembly factor BamD